MTDDVVAAVVADLGLPVPADAAERLDEGLVHDTYALAGDDRSYVVQVADPADETPLRLGLACYRRLRDAPVPVPAVVTPEPRRHGDRAYTVVERLPGETVSGGAAPEVVRAAGRTLARLHDLRSFEAAGRLRPADGGLAVDPAADGVAWRVADDTVETLRANGLAAAADALGGLDDAPGGPGPPTFCHGDFSPDNVLAADGAVTGVLDFDHAHAGDAGRDLALAATAF